MTPVAVLTGDLIASTRAPPEAVDKAMAALAEAAAQISTWAGNDTRFTRFRGDGWQIYIANQALVLRATLLLLAKLRATGGGLKTRLSVAVGTIDRLGDQGLAGATGEAFSLSGRNLDEMTPYFTFVYAEPAKRDPWKPAVMDLAVWQAGTWSREQAEAVAMALERPRQKDEKLARRLGITRQALQARLKGSGIMATSHALLAFEIDHTWPEPPDV